MQTVSEPLSIAEPAISVRQTLDRWFGHLLAAVCVVLLTSEIVLLIIGVVARYAFHAPQVWVDELTSLLFLWLAMLGAVLALRGSAHMRMTALISRSTGATRRGLEALATAAALLFLLCVLMPAYRYVQNEQIVSLSTIANSTPNGTASSVTKPGRCWRNTSAKSPEER
jgi:TRAP-type C4-dicarboxylate transport system permease small subunit